MHRAGNNPSAGGVYSNGPSPKKCFRMLGETVRGGASTTNPLHAVVTGS